MNIPALVYGDLTGQPRPPRATARPGVRWVDAHADWRAFEGSSARWLAEMLRAEVNESFMLRDPLPALDDVLGILQRKLLMLREARSYLRSAR